MVLAEPATEPPPGGRRQHLRWLRRGTVVLVFILALEYLVLPQIAGTRQALHVFGDVEPLWLVLGVALEILNFLSYSLLTRSVLPDHRPTYWWIFRSDMTAFGLSHIVPGGAATASPVRYRLLRDGGTPPQDAVIGATVEAVGSTLILVAILWVSLVLSVIFIDFRTSYLVAAAIGAVMIAAAVFGLVEISRGIDRAQTVIAKLVAKLPKRIQGSVGRAVDRAATQVAQLLANHRELRRSAQWAAGSWLLDAASLGVFLLAYGWHPNIIGLLVGYSLANVLAVLPISPGGLGVIEGVLIPSLVGFGAPRAAAVLGVVSWRLFNFWLPIPTAGVFYLSLRTQKWRDGWKLSPGIQRLKEFARERAEPSPPPPVPPALVPDRE